ncbi:hypothetical protein BFP71_14585 [Roseivirga misakiensis]|uniref:Uncharacterized protein n=2 Tax=Roseivirga misakiensis TaxID=1563681 RepID=A0A1E5T043_9BACT|nr:hypothetical protein BFP71_14585 [Roseivirga misakiensis]
MVWLSIELDGMTMTWQYIETNMYFIFTFGYMIFMARVIHNSHVNSFDKLLASGDFDQERRSFWKYEMSNQRKLTIETIVALLIGFIHAYLDVFQWIINGTRDFTFTRLGIGFEIMLMWLVITHATSTFMRNMTVMNKMSREIDIDLLNMDKFMPLTKSGITSTLGFIGAYSLLFVQGVRIIDIQNPAIAIIIPSIFFLIRTPLKGIRKRVSIAKHKELILVDAAIEGDREALKKSRIHKNLDNINVIDLINYRKIIQSVFEIPVNIPTASRFIFYLIIPLLTWIAASVVDKVIDYLIK